MQRVSHFIPRGSDRKCRRRVLDESGATAPRREEHSGAAAAKAIDALDRCVQVRFIRIDKSFGLSRNLDGDAQYAALCADQRC